MSETLLQIPGEIRKVETKQHKSLRIIFDSQQEIQSAVRAKLMEHIERVGWFTFLPGEELIEPELVLHDLPEIKRNTEEKSQSQRLRNVLYRIWEQKGKPNPIGAKSEAQAFDYFYRDRMEMIIEKLKEQLN